MEKYKQYTEQLRNSTMFHMSLGSKELFHSNFLHWISQVDWGGFLKIMHGLAGIETFWWEGNKCNVDGYDTEYCPNNNNLEVRREYHNFDLSIYILDSEKDPSEKENTIGNIQKNDNDEEDNIAFTIAPNGVRKVQKWIPVLILENKMKSIPYHEQLVKYTSKAFEEWRKGKLIKDKINKLKEDGPSVTSEWINQDCLTFIILTLTDTSFVKEVSHSWKYGRSKQTQMTKLEWKHKTYRDLLELLKDVSLQKPLDSSVLADYKDFLTALINLASIWKINPKDSFRTQVFPWHTTAEEQKQELEEYKKLRIHDIHEKLMYSHLLSLLNNKLSELQPKPYNEKTIKTDFWDVSRIFTRSDYAHGIGLFEVQYLVFPFGETQEKGKEDFFKLIIQIQGNRYCHMLICDDIVQEESTVTSNNKKKRIINVNTAKLQDYNAVLGDIQKTIGRFISVEEPCPCNNNVAPEKGKYCHYGKNNIYQYADIPVCATVNDVIDRMVGDIKAIDRWAKDIPQKMKQRQQNCCPTNRSSMIINGQIQ